jgi:hypothetical protein
MWIIWTLKSTRTQVEGFYSIFKRGMKGVYQHCGNQHLHRYNNRTAIGVDDVGPGQIALRGVVGKRLTYQGPNEKRA